MLGNITNPLNQPQTPDFGQNYIIPKAVNTRYTKARGNLVDAQNYTLQYPPTTHLPNTMTKAGESMNRMPIPISPDLTNIKYDQRSTSTHARIDEGPRVGLQLGMPDQYLDSPFQDWTYGAQYYTLYTGKNLKTQITPVIYPQSHRRSTWDQDIHNFDEVNSWTVQDITSQTMDYGCKDCDIASTSLGTPVFYEPRNPYAPLPVALYNGEYPNVGYYTAKELGRSTRDWPPPINAVMELQRRKAGFAPTPIVPDYSEKILDELRHGFDFS